MTRDPLLAMNVFATLLAMLCCRLGIDLLGIDLMLLRRTIRWRRVRLVGIGLVLCGFALFQTALRLHWPGSG